MAPNLKTLFPSMTVPMDMGAQGNVSPSWYYYLQALFNRTGGQSGVDAAALKSEADDTAVLTAMSQPIRGTSKPPLISVTPGASPFSYPAPFSGNVVIDGGTVSAIAFSRDGTHFITYPTGVVPVAQGDIVKVTYSAAPTMTMVGSEQ